MEKVEESIVSISVTMEKFCDAAQSSLYIEVNKLWRLKVKAQICYKNKDADESTDFISEPVILLMFLILVMMKFYILAKRSNLSHL